MQTKTFQDLFEYHTRAMKHELEKGDTALTAPHLAVYTSMRYDGTMGTLSSSLTTSNIPDMINQARIFAIKMQQEQPFKEPVGAAFLSMRMFYDTEKVKGKQVLLIFGLTIDGQAGEAIVEFKQNQKVISFSDMTYGIFSYQVTADQFLVLKAFYSTSGIIIPRIVLFKDLFTLGRLIEHISKPEKNLS